MIRSHLRYVSSEVRKCSAVASICLATADDVTAIQSCNRRNLPENYTVEYIRQQLKQWPLLSIVAKNDDGDVIGYALGLIETTALNFPRTGVEKTGHVLSVAVEEPFRREGLGFRLMKSLHAQFVLQCPPLRSVNLFCRVSNTAAITHYKDKHGYECTKLLTEYYEDGENAWFMEHQCKGV